MKTLTILALITIFSVSGCSDFIGTDEKQEARSSQPSPSDYDTKLNIDEEGTVRNTSKAAPILPGKKL